MREVITKEKKIPLIFVSQIMLKAKGKVVGTAMLDKFGEKLKEAFDELTEELKKEGIDLSYDYRASRWIFK